MKLEDVVVITHDWVYVYIGHGGRAFDAAHWLGTEVRFRWVRLDRHSARVWAICFAGGTGWACFADGRVNHTTLLGRRIWQCPSDAAAIEAIDRSLYRWDRERLGKPPIVAAPRVPRTRRLELLRLQGIRHCGRVGDATRIRSEPPRWDGFGPPPYAEVVVPDDRRREILARIDSLPQYEYLVGGGDKHRAAFGFAGAHLCFERVTLGD